MIPYDDINTTNLDEAIAEIREEIDSDYKGRSHLLNGNTGSIKLAASTYANISRRELMLDFLTGIRDTIQKRSGR